MWDPTGPTKKTKNKDGTTGWVIVKCSTNAVYGAGSKFRVHMCAHNPCRAHWSDAKYGLSGPPVHMQGITCMGPNAAPLLPMTAPPVADPSSTETTVAAPEPSSTTTAVAASAAPISKAAIQAAKDRIEAAALRLAREIRKPKAWIGYVAFVLFALLKRTKVHVWEGDYKFNLIKHFAPWAEGHCTKECAYAAIPCGLKRSIDGLAECVQISEEAPLTRMAHWVAGIDIPSAPMTAVAA